MAESSIFENIIIDTEDAAARLIDALEQSAQDGPGTAAADVKFVEGEELAALLKRACEK